MLKRIKTLLKDNSIFLALAITIGILCLSLIKMPKTDIQISNIDKFYHSFAYFVLAISWLFTYRKKPKVKYLVVIGCIIFGIIIEVFQNALTDYRTGDYLDVLANSFGVVLALLIFNVFSKKNYIN